jgi:hypothetical protein
MFEEMIMVDGQSATSLTLKFLSLQNQDAVFYIMMFSDKQANDRKNMNAKLLNLL